MGPRNSPGDGPATAGAGRVWPLETRPDPRQDQRGPNKAHLNSGSRPQRSSLQVPPRWQPATPRKLTWSETVSARRGPKTAHPPMQRRRPRKAPKALTRNAPRVPTPTPTQPSRCRPGLRSLPGRRPRKAHAGRFRRNRGRGHIHSPDRPKQLTSRVRRIHIHSPKAPNPLTPGPKTAHSPTEKLNAIKHLRRRQSSRTQL